MLIIECIVLFKYSLKTARIGALWILLPVLYYISQLFEHFQIQQFGSRHRYIGKHKSSIGRAFTLDFK